MLINIHGKMKRKYFFLFLFIALMLGSIAMTAQTDTLIFQPGPNEGKDALIRDDYPDTPMGLETNFTSNAWTVGGIPCLLRSLIEFNLSSIPKNTIIVSAKLSLFCNVNSGIYQLQSGDNQSFLLRVTQPWDENSVTWNNQPFTTMENPVILSTSTSNTQNYPNIDVTSQVQEMVNKPTANFGWMLQLVTEQFYASMVFASSDNSVEDWRPKLTIIYQTCTPSDANFSYSINNNIVSFTDLSPSANSWYWDFGDGYFSNIQNPLHTYSEHGRFLCCLNITDTCGSSSYCDTVFYCNNPNTRFTYTNDGHMVTFSDSSIMADTWFWNFGDGFYSDLQNPIHYFDHYGTFHVCLTATNACKQETFCDTVSVKVNGIEELKDDYFLLYPNPTRNKLFVSINKKIMDSKIAFTIVNSNGENVKMTELSHSGNTEEIILDISDLPSGVFYLKISLPNMIKGKKFIKI